MRDRSKRCVRAVVLVLGLAAPGAAADAHAQAGAAHGAAHGAQGAHAAHHASAADSADVAATVSAYHLALGQGDTLRAVALLAPDAVILESGGVESLAEYRSHHLGADSEFARAVREERSPIRVVVRGDAAWASSTSSAKGTFRGRAIDSMGAELMVLVRTPDGWRIAAIHWSSRRRA